MTNLVPNKTGNVNVEQLDYSDTFSAQIFNTINQNLINNIEQVEGVKIYNSPLQAMTDREKYLSFNHDLGKTPEILQLILHCISTPSTNNVEYVAGDTIIINASNNEWNAVVTTTQVKAVYLSWRLRFWRKTSKSTFQLSWLPATNYNWSIRAIAL